MHHAAPKTCLLRLWTIRRVVWTKSFISFANVGENAAFDTIPLAEVSSVEQINQEPREGYMGLQSVEGPKSADSAKTLFRNALQLKTDADGYNSGRTYYLQASSAEQCGAVCASLVLLARRARKAVVAGTRMRRLQGRVLRAYESVAFQSGVAVLIIAVRTTRVPADVRIVCAIDGAAVCKRAGHYVGFEAQRRPTARSRCRSAERPAAGSSLGGSAPAYGEMPLSAAEMRQRSAAGLRRIRPPAGRRFEPRATLLFCLFDPCLFRGSVFGGVFGGFSGSRALPRRPFRRAPMPPCADARESVSDGSSPADSLARYCTELDTVLQPINNRIDR